MWEYVIQAIAAFGAILAFSLLLHVSRSHILWCGLGGMICWILFLMVRNYAGNDVTAAFVATLWVSLYSHILARMVKAPVTVFFMAGILPLVPGGGIYYTAYYYMNGSMILGGQYLLYTLKIAGAIAVGIFLVDTVFTKIVHAHKSGKPA